MISAARRASLLVAFYLLTSASTAYAECAWVLWSQYTSTNPAAPREGVWDPQRAFDTQKPCEASSERMNQGRSPRRGEDGHNYSARYVYLPDAVDPRGPKR